MAHSPAPIPPRRAAERVLGALLLLAGISLAVIAYSALGHPGGRHAGGSLLPSLATPPMLAAGPAAAGSKATPEQASHNQGAGPATSTGVPLTVLDNTHRPALASLARDRFEQAGWTVTGTGAFDGDILSTAAYYDPSEPGAQAAAEALQAQFPEIQRVRPKFDGMGPGAVVVVLTYDYSQGQTTS
ncbi:MAG: LytR C-terminal domain-containing protein [Jatrophihabitantaceae bacterium]